MNKKPILITTPHSSLFVPKDLRTKMNLTDKQIRAHVDLATDEIFSVRDTHHVKAGINRLVVDPNRAPDDIEMEALLANEGVVVAISEDGRNIYKKPPTVNEIFERVKKYHEKFHQEIDAIEPSVKFMIDGHSMKSIGPQNKPDAGKKRPDIILGNRDYTTCSREYTLKIKEFFENKGYKVAVNSPYKGKYVIGYHCSRRGLLGIQIEFNRALYMDEEKVVTNPKKVKILNDITGDLVDMLMYNIDRNEIRY